MVFLELLHEISDFNSPIFLMKLVSFIDLVSNEVSDFNSPSFSMKPVALLTD